MVERIKKHILSLDDFAFEGRNRDYGAYMLRKTYQARLFRSFIYALSIFLALIFSYELISHFHPGDNTLYNLRGVQTVDVNLTYNQFIPVKAKPAGGGSSQAQVIPEKIVPDNQVVTKPEKVETPATGDNDSTGINSTGHGRGFGSGDSEFGGEGIDGELFGSADINPQFPGGAKAMQEYIRANLHYPETAQRLGIRGTILIYIVIMRDGSLRNIKIVKGLHPDLDNEALRVVRSMPPWRPAMRGGAAVNVRCTMPISVSPRANS